MADNNKKTNQEINNMKQGIENTESLQSILKSAKNQYQVTMKKWLYTSLITSILVIGGMVYIYIENYGKFNVSNMTITAFIGVLKLLVIRQYTNAKRLVIETNNRLIASKLLANISNSKMDKEIKVLIYPKVINSIIDSHYNQTPQGSNTDSELNKLATTILKAGGKGK